jgi:hypothetical protein
MLIHYSKHSSRWSPAYVTAWNAFNWTIFRSTIRKKEKNMFVRKTFTDGWVVTRHDEFSSTKDILADGLPLWTVHCCRNGMVSKCQYSISWQENRYTFSKESLQNTTQLLNILCIKYQCAILKFEVPLQPFRISLENYYQYVNCQKTQQIFIKLISECYMSRS